MNDISEVQEAADILLNAISKSSMTMLPEDVVRMFFHHMFFRLLENNMLKQDTGSTAADRLEYDAHQKTRSESIAIMRNVPLGEYQQSVEWYEKEVDAVFQDFLNTVGHHHSGIDTVNVDHSRELSINIDELVRREGLVKPF